MRERDCPNVPTLKLYHTVFCDFRWLHDVISAGRDAEVGVTYANIKRWMANQLVHPDQPISAEMHHQKMVLQDSKVCQYSIAND